MTQQNYYGQELYTCLECGRLYWTEELKRVPLKGSGMLAVYCPEGHELWEEPTNEYPI